MMPVIIILRLKIQLIISPDIIKKLWFQKIEAVQQKEKTTLFNLNVTLG